MEISEKQAMMRDIALQIALILLMIFMFLYMHGIPQRLLAKFRYRNRPTTQAKLHFVKGAQLLAQARSSKNPTGSGSNRSLTEEALAEADKAIALNPKDAAPYLLKSMALEIQGFRTSALESLDVALSPLAAKSLDDGERGDALLKRAQLRMAVSERGRVDSVLDDLTRSVKLSPKNVKAWCLLGECYEEKKMDEEAKEAYEKALELEPQLNVVQEALNRLGSSSSSS